MTKLPLGPPAAARLLLALALTGLVGAAAAPARADDDWRHHERIERERIEREREWRAHHRHPVYVAPPAYVYAPPPVVYAPPPPSAGINLIFPLTIR